VGLQISAVTLWADADFKQKTIPWRRTDVGCTELVGTAAGVALRIDIPIALV